MRWLTTIRRGGGVSARDLSVVLRLANPKI
jgi:hypothetical protein